MKLSFCAGMTVRHAGQLARITRVWDGGEGFAPKLDIFYLAGTWQGMCLRVDPESIEEVAAVATLRREFIQGALA